MSDLTPINLGGFVLTDTGLQVESSPTLEQFRQAAAYLGKRERITRWMIGDLLIACQQRYHEAYAQVAADTGLEPETIRSCLWLAEKIPLERRRDSLSWSIHREVGSLPPPKQDEILDRAAAEGMTREQVRNIVREEKGLPPVGAAILTDPLPPSPATIDVTPPPVPSPPPIPDGCVPCAACEGKGHVPCPQKPRKAGDTVGETFDLFYAAYPRHVGRAAAEKAWRKLKPDQNLVQVILAALEQHKRQPRWREDPQFIPHPASWLNGRRWEDEIAQPHQDNGRFSQDLLDFAREDDER